jgi:6-phosphogluconate dehydrogenase
MRNPQQSSFGVIGLGKMGTGIVRHALSKGYRVVGLDKRPPDDLKDERFIEASDVRVFSALLPPTKIVFLYVPAGPVVDSVLDQLCGVLSAGDIVVDGGNSYWGDSIRRHARLRDTGIQFVDAGTSGGPGGALGGACFMVGGEKAPVAVLEPILRDLAVEGGYVHAGGPGAGHFVKLVHNGIEFGMLQAIGEGMDLLESYREKLPTADILSCWSHGSVIRSWLVELMEKLYRQEGGLSKVPAYVEDTGEVNWLVEDAIRMEVPIPVITQSVLQLLASRDQKQNWARAIAMMRHGFGGHPYGADAGIVRERETGRVGDFVGAAVNPQPNQ